jgi:hypothetical protein
MSSVPKRVNAIATRGVRRCGRTLENAPGTDALRRHSVQEPRCHDHVDERAVLATATAEQLRAHGERPGCTTSSSGPSDAAIFSVGTAMLATTLTAS